MEIRSDTSSPGVGSESRWPASKEEILEEMVAKSTEIDFLKSDKTSLKELTNSEFCKTEEELD
jgi:cell shape-determining protein MreC